MLKKDCRFCEVAEESEVGKVFQEEVALTWDLEDGGRALRSRGLDAEGLLGARALRCGHVGPA